MRKLIVDEWMDARRGRARASSPDEDTDDGFQHGGWHTPYFDELSMTWTGKNVTSAGATYSGAAPTRSFAAHWPNAAEEEHAVAEPLNTRPKYVASTTLAEPLEWQFVRNRPTHGKPNGRSEHLKAACEESHHRLRPSGSTCTNFTRPDRDVT